MISLLFPVFLAPPLQLGITKNNISHPVYYYIMFGHE
jgi:hypothetical protein